MRRIHEQLGLGRVINARGTYTPLGVSRSSEPVIEAVAQSLRQFFDMKELHETAGQKIAGLTGAEWGVVTHCTAASITLSVAALMTGREAANIQALPDTSSMKSRIVMQAGHLINYGQPIEQAIRLSGAEVVVAGSRDNCTEKELESILSCDDVCGLMLVHSRLCRGDMVKAEAAIALAHANGIPVIIDAAAQDLVMADILALGADLSLFSAQKYLAAPTSGLVLGKRDLAETVHLQEGGIGRGMKAGKEAIIGAVVALQQRGKMDAKAWAGEQARKAGEFVRGLNRLTPVTAELVPDPMGNPFSRVRVHLDGESCNKTVPEVEAALAAADPAIIVQDHADMATSLMFEINPLTEQELEIIISQLAVIVFNRPPDGMRRRNIQEW